MFYSHYPPLAPGLIGKEIRLIFKLKLAFICLCKKLKIDNKQELTDKLLNQSVTSKKPALMFVQRRI
jgi:hypothetical protein